MTSRLNLQTLYIPKRLADSLENIKKYPLTVLEAPSGFGKTTALSEFFSHGYFKDKYILKRTFFTADTDEYWRRFCDALSDADRICADALRALGTPCDENMSDIREILSESECARETYIVLDNLSGSAEGINAFLTALSCNRAEGLHIVASVQSVNTQNSFRFLGGGSAYCIDAEDFTFSAADCREYFESAGIVLTDAELSELTDITGGWIFAVYLQMVFYAKNKRFEKGILSALIETAFFDRLSDKERNFYISLSPLKSFTLSRAAEVSGTGADFARAMLRGGVFIHYDSKSREYYFHNLLYDYLSGIFARLDCEEKKRLLIKAAECEERCGSKINAFSLYYRAGAYERIFEMPLTSYDLSDIGDENTRGMIFDILDKTPRVFKLRHLENMVPLAFILFFLGESEKLGEVIGEISELAESSELPPDRKNAVLGETELLISFTAFNDIAEMSRHHRRAFKLLGKRASLINMRSTWSFGSPSVACLYHREPGSLDRELELMDECMPYYYRLTGGHGSGAEYAMRAEAELLRGSLDKAATAAHRAMFEAQSKNQPCVYQCGLFTLANLALLRGDESELSEILFTMSESAVSNTEDMCRYTLSLFLGFIYAFTHRPDKVDAWLLNGDINGGRVAPMTAPFAHIVYARVLLEKKEYTKLLAFCPFAAEYAAALPSILPQIYFGIFECCAHAALGDSAAAENSLKCALSLAASDGIFLPFAQSYSEIKPILEKLRPESAYGEISRLGAEFERSAARIGGGKPKLSPREREVAELICHGLTNKQIAARLFVSISTVKLTVSNIFDKTGVRSRAQLSDTKL